MTMTKSSSPSLPIEPIEDMEFSEEIYIDDLIDARCMGMVGQGHGHGNSNHDDNDYEAQVQVHGLPPPITNITTFSMSHSNINNDNDDNNGMNESIGNHDTAAAAAAAVASPFLGTWSATCILINFISVGYILNPAAFAMGGTIIGTICLLFVSIQSWITGTFVLESCARAEALTVSLSHSKHLLSLQELFGQHPSEQEQHQEQQNEEETGITNNTASADASSCASAGAGEGEGEGEGEGGGGAEDCDDTNISSDSSSSNNTTTANDTPAMATTTTTTTTTTPTPTTKSIIPSTSTSKITRRYLPTDHSMIIHQRTYELSELCRIFLGRNVRNFFTLMMCGDLYGITWSFAAIFGSSLSEHLVVFHDNDNDNDEDDMSNKNYQFYIILFMILTIPASCLNFGLQVPIQLSFLIARTIMIVLMITTLIVAFVASPTPHFGTFNPTTTTTPFVTNDLNFTTIVTVLQLCVFSTAYQFGVPGLTAETGNKRNMKTIISQSVMYIYITNLILSIIMSLYFGITTSDSSNLNWLYYHGGTWDGHGEFTRSWWAKGISSYIVLFAAIDGLAVYPLIAISLGDILMSAVFEENVHDMIGNTNRDGSNENNNNNSNNRCDANNNNWKYRIAFRLLASVPQAVGSLFIKDLGEIAKYAGIFTLLSYTICPSCLAIASRKVVEEVELPSKTSYKAIMGCSSDYVAMFLIGVATTLIIGVIVEAVQ